MRFTIKARLAAAFSAVLVLTAVSAYLGISSLGQVNDRMEGIVSGPAERMKTVLDLKADLSAAAWIEKNIIQDNDVERMKLSHENLLKIRGDIQGKLNHWRQIATVAGRKLLDQIGPMVDEYVKFQDETIRLAMLNSNARAKSLSDGRAGEAFGTARKVLRGLVESVAANAPAAPILAHLTVEMLDVRLHEKDMILSEEDARKRAVAQTIDDIVRETQAETAALRDQASPAQRPGLQRFANAWDAYLAIHRQVREATLENGTALASALSVGKNKALVDKLLALMDEVEGVAMRGMQDTVAESERIYSESRVLLTIMALTSIVIGIVVALWISLTIARGLARAGGLAQAVSGGDLTQTVDYHGREEIGDLIGHLNAMVARLREVVTDITSGAENVASGANSVASGASDATSAAQNVAAGSEQLSASAESLSQGVSEQAASTEQASSSMEQMASNIRQNADNATETEKIARQSAVDADKSGGAVAKAVAAMKTIAEKISIVQEIARQTDLLALNAAI